ncbi:hypothetical protein QTP70_022477, partial [Hemibagrus guttatus]
ATLMMSLRLTPPLPLLFLLMVSGVVSQSEWSVTYTPSYICAPKGSTVTMGCIYTYPTNYTVQRAFWSRQLVTNKEPPDLSSDPNYRNRVQYLGDKLNDCRLRLSGVREQDQGKYYFRFLTNNGGKRHGKDGVELSVTELQVEMSSDTVVEGDGVTLTCKTTCSLTETPTFSWYKQGSNLHFISNFNPLRLPSVSQRDAGHYNCSVQGYSSPPVTLNVQYPPKRVSVSISPSGGIVEGRSVTLTCSGDANPPVQNYTWYKGNSHMSTGHTYRINRIRSEDSGDYTCRAENKHGYQLSAAVSLNVLYPPKSVSVSISPSGEIVEGSSVTLTCSSDANPPVQSYTWYKVNESSPVGSGQSYNFTLSSSSSGEFYCVAQNKYGSQRAPAVPLTLNPITGEREQEVQVIMQSLVRAEEAELEMLRFSLGMTRLDRIRNEYIRGTAHGGHLKEKKKKRERRRRRRRRRKKKKKKKRKKKKRKKKKKKKKKKRKKEKKEKKKRKKKKKRRKKLTPPLPLLFLLMISRVVSQLGWSVTYTPSYICALKGSTVTMGCTYRYPTGYTVQKAFWSRQLVTDEEPPDLSSDTNYRNRVQYLGDKLNDCRLGLRDVREQDQGKYYFRFLTTRDQKYQGRDGVELSVTELQVEMSSDTVVEGDGVTLTCKTTCSLTQTFSWYKDRHYFSYSNPLRLPSVSQRDAGRYSCSVQGYYSPPVTLNVQYPPKSVSVSISSSGEIVEGRSVTLTCSSDANPPVQNYTWYKGSSHMSTGHTYRINSIRSEDSGNYTCRAENEHGYQLSAAVSLNVLYPPKSVSVSISSSGEIVEGSSVTLACSSDANPPVQSYTWYKVNESSPVGSGQSYNFTLSSSSSGEFYCVAQNKYGSQRAPAVPLTLNSITGVRSVVLYVVLGVIVGCGCLLAIVGVLYIRRKRRSSAADDENTYATVNSAASNNPTPHPDLVNQNDVHYASIQHRRAGSSPVQASGSSATEVVQYATVQYRGDRLVEKTQEHDDHYANVKFNLTGAAYRSDAPAPDSSVIYSV